MCRFVCDSRFKNSIFIRSVEGNLVPHTFISVKKKIIECNTRGDNYDVYLGNAKCSNVLAVRRSAISSSPQSSQDAANSLHSNASVDGVSWRRRCTGQTSTSIIVTDGFHGWCQDASHHTQHWRHTHCRQTPLTLSMIQNKQTLAPKVHMLKSRDLFSSWSVEGFIDRQLYTTSVRTKVCMTQCWLYSIF